MAKVELVPRDLALDHWLYFLMLEHLWYPENDVHFTLSAMVTHGISLSRMSTVFLPITLFASGYSPILTRSSLQPCLQTREKPFRITDLIIQCSCLQIYSVPGPTAYFSCSFLSMVYKPLSNYSFLWNNCPFSQVSWTSHSSTFLRLVPLSWRALLTSGSPHPLLLWLIIEPLVNLLVLSM